MITINTFYQKRLGLPAYSSHSFQVSVESEILNLENLPNEVNRLYKLLQESVDREIQQTGFVPNDDYGLTKVPPPAPNSGANGDSGHSGHSPNGNHNRESNGNHSTNGAFQCSEKQRTLILDLQKQLGLSDADLDEHSHQLFSKPVRQLNKLSASGLITALLEIAGKSNGRNGNRNGHRPATNEGGR